MASGPITPWEVDGETVETVAEFIFLGSKITADGDCSHEIKGSLLLGSRVMTNLDSILKSRDSVGECGVIWENGIETCIMSYMKGISSPGSMLDTGCLGLVHWDDPEGWYGWISLQSKGLSRVFSNTTVQKHQFFGAQLSLQSNSHIHT